MSVVFLSRCKLPRRYGGTPGTKHSAERQYARSSSPSGDSTTSLDAAHPLTEPAVRALAVGQRRRHSRVPFMAYLTRLVGSPRIAK